MERLLCRMNRDRETVSAEDKSKRAEPSDGQSDSEEVPPTWR